jgi:uncharacterized membrane protein YfcA
MGKRNKTLFIVIINLLLTLFVWIGLVLNKINWDDLLIILLVLFVFNSISSIVVFRNRKNIDINLFRLFIMLGILIYFFQVFYLKVYFDLNVRD